MSSRRQPASPTRRRSRCSNGTEPPPPPDEPDPSKTILYKRDANTNAGVGPATFKFSSVTNGDYEFDTNASGELESIQWWDPTEAEGKYIKPGEYAVTEIVPPPNYMPTTEVQQIKLELDKDGNPIPAGPLVFKNLAREIIKQCAEEQIAAAPPYLLEHFAMNADYQILDTLVKKGISGQGSAAQTLHMLTYYNIFWSKT